MASIAVDVMVVPADRFLDYASSYRSPSRMSRNTRKTARMLAPNNAAVRSNHNILAARDNRKNACPIGGDASRDDALPSAHGAAIGAPGIADRSSHHPSKQAGPAIVRLMGYLPGQMFPLPRH
jgi:hypothetical protein